MSTTGESSTRPDVGSNSLAARITVTTMEGFSSALRVTPNAREAITRSSGLSSHWRNRDLASLTLISRLQDSARQPTPEKCCMSRIFKLVYVWYTDNALILFLVFPNAARVFFLRFSWQMSQI